MRELPELHPRYATDHPVRTEFIQGVLANESTTRSLLEDVIDPTQYGIEEDGTPPVANDEGSAVVCDPPALRFSITSMQEAEVRQTIESSDNDDYGISQYLSVLQLVQNWDSAY